MTPRILIVLVAIILCFSDFESLAQTLQLDIYGCGSDIMRQQNFNKNPKIKYKHDSIEHALLQNHLQWQFSITKSGGGLPTPQQIYTIPVVVHIIHNNGSENIPDAQVTTAIQHLNDAFRNIGFYDPSTGVDVEIGFCLAQQDENGVFTTGINRVVSSYTNMTMETEDLNVKNLIRWNPTKYLNIWIVNEITSQSMGSGVAGYAYFPSSHGNPEDGIVNEANYFGFTPDNSKVVIHEVGHYLGLYHTFEGGCTNNNCLTDGDKVCDTPPDASTAPVACGAIINTCTTDENDVSTNNPFRPVSIGGLGGQNDMYINYMDYGFQTCQSAFTLGQKNRMISSLTGPRHSLLESFGCQPPCFNPITSSYTVSATNVLIGTTVNFTNTTVGATSYSWEVNGTEFSTSTNASYTFNTQGTYTVTLVAANGNVSCTKEVESTIFVTCPATAAFTSSSTSVMPGDTVTFTNTSTGATSFQWSIDGTSLGTGTDLTHTFPNAGGFMISLTASNGTCSTTYYQFINVGVCKSKKGNIWCIGDDTGIDFNSGNPVPITMGVWAWEGTSTMCDANGNLLFYTNGEAVWDTNNDTMPNGAGLLGHLSSQQSCIIIPAPGMCNLYYIFTTDANENQYQNGLRYSVVDMTLNNGIGDVTTKNVLLHTPSFGEVLTAIKHSNGKDVWIVTADTGGTGIVSYLLTSSGVNPTPVLSFPNVPIYGPYVPSPLGNKLAFSTTLPPPIYLQRAALADFDNSTGIVSNPVVLLSNNTYGAIHGDFSSNGTKFYTTETVNDNYPDHDNHIIQYDLSVSSYPSTIIDTVYNATEGWPFLLKTAPDGKMYVMKRCVQGFGCNSYSSLSVINNPNALGTACDYQPNVMHMPSMWGTASNPNFLNDYTELSKVSINGRDTVCLHESSVEYIVYKDCSDINTVWLLNGNSITATTDTSVVLNFQNEGTDTLITEVTRACGTIARDTLYITVSPAFASDFGLGADTIICTGNNIVLNAGTGYISYLWQDGSINQTFTVNTPGQYQVTVADSTGCEATDSIVINPASNAPLDLGNDIYSCKGLISVLDAGSGFSSYKWQDGSANQTFSVYLPGKYWVTVSACGITYSDTVTVDWDSNMPVAIEKEGELCDGKNVNLKAIPGNLSSYIWDDGSYNNNRDVQSSGIYWVTVTDTSGCYGVDTITVANDNCNCTLEIPTAFSPNNDGHNDYFILQGFDRCVDEFQIRIFDRWGEKVFETQNILKAWDGTYHDKPMNSGVFVYHIEATLLTGESVVKKGNITLIR